MSNESVLCLESEKQMKAKGKQCQVLLNKTVNKIVWLPLFREEMNVKPKLLNVWYIKNGKKSKLIRKLLYLNMEKQPKERILEIYDFFNAHSPCIF